MIQSIKYLLFFSVLLLPLATPCNTLGGEKLSVTASLYPLAHFAEQVGGDLVSVSNIMPPGSEPHSYEPTPRDIRNIYRSNIFIFHGGGIDTWAERIIPDLSKQGIQILNMAGHSRMDPGRKSGHDHDHGEADPHTWLDPLKAKEDVAAIMNALIKIDPLHIDTYQRRGNEYINKLQALHLSFEEGLRTCRKRDIIVTHNAFNYLASRYKIVSHAISGLSPDEEPSARKLAKLSVLARDSGIKYIFFEELVSPRLAMTIAREVDAEILVLNPLGSITASQSTAGETYISIMKNNLRNLREAMECN